MVIPTVYYCISSITVYHGVDIKGITINECPIPAVYYIIFGRADLYITIVVYFLLKVVSYISAQIKILEMSTRPETN